MIWNSQGIWWWLYCGATIFYSATVTFATCHYGLLQSASCRKMERVAFHNVCQWQQAGRCDCQMKIAHSIKWDGIASWYKLENAGLFFGCVFHTPPWLHFCHRHRAKFHNMFAKGPSCCIVLSKKKIIKSFQSLLFFKVPKTSKYLLTPEFISSTKQNIKCCEWCYRERKKAYQIGFGTESCHTSLKRNEWGMYKMTKQDGYFLTVTHKYLGGWGQCQ